MTAPTHRAKARGFTDLVMGGGKRDSLVRFGVFERLSASPVPPGAAKRPAPPASVLRRKGEFFRENRSLGTLSARLWAWSSDVENDCLVREARHRTLARNRARVRQVARILP